MPSQIEKLQAHSSHLLDGFLGLREKYAMLEPMLFDIEVVTEHGSNQRKRGFTILRNTLFLSCVQDIAKLSLDSDNNAPSIKNIIKALESEVLRLELRKQFASWKMPSIGENDPAIIENLQKLELQKEEQRRTEFDTNYSQLLGLWNQLAASSILDAFRIIRNKLSAHMDIHYVDGSYKLLDISTFGVNWNNLRESIAALQEIVELLGLLIRNSGFAWDDLDTQLVKTGASFWCGNNGTYLHSGID